MEDLTANWIIAGQHGGFDIGCGLLQMALRMTQRFFVLLPPYRRILDKSDDTEMESAVRALFSDVLKTGERIIIQVEEKWGDSTSLVPRPRFPQLRMDYITATWKVGLGFSYTKVVLVRLILGAQSECRAPVTSR